MMNDIFEQLTAVLADRKQSSPEQSYVAKLYANGLDAILQKVGEEATETILAAKNGNTHDLVHETADLWFHTLVMLSHQDINPNEVFAELQRRFGLSGLVEKAARTHSKANSSNN